jgi:hypothetical protein
MTLVEQVEKARDILRAALANEGDWRGAAQLFLSPIKVEPNKPLGNKWAGEQCKICRHSNNVHANHTGICFCANCGCDHFEPSGIEMNS